MKEKTFYKILVEFSLSIETTKRRISDMRLTSVEKLIIEGQLNIRKNLNQEVLTSMSETNPSELPFVESQRLLLTAYALNNLSKFTEAEKFVMQSIEILHKIEAPFFLFNSYHLLFTIYDNLHLTSHMERTIQKMDGLQMNKRQEVQYLMCKFCYHHQAQETALAEKVLPKIDARINDLTEGDIVRQLVNKFMFLVQQEKLESAKKVMGELKQYRNYQLSENYNFMKKLLDHLTDSAPLYIYDHQFETIPVLLHQLKVIQCLEEKQPEQARFHWSMLKEISPATYGEAFDYKGSTCLFSLALKKHCEHEIVPDLPMKAVGDNKLEQLYSILNESKIPVHGAMIHEIIWGTTPVEKEDFKKVSRLISRLKTVKNVTVEFRKGAYTMAKTKVAKVS